MFSAAEKTVRNATVVQRQSAAPFFARKHDTAFFGGGEKSLSGSSSFIQPKLSVSQPDDPQEKEADQMAGKVMTMPESTVAASPQEEKKEEVQRAADEEVQKAEDPKEEKQLQRVAGPTEEKEQEQVQRSAEEEVQKKEEAEQEEKQVQRVAAEEEKEKVQRSADEEVQKKEEQKETLQRNASDKEEEKSVQRMCKDCDEKKETAQRKEDKEEVQAKLFDVAVPGSQGSMTVQRAEEKEKDDKPISRKEISSAHAFRYIQRSGRGPPSSGNTFEQNLESSRGVGSPMPGETRAFMESRFQADFSGVRIHTGETSVQMNKEINAQAFTYGNDIYFNNGKYSPGTSEGKTLLAHELTHTIQQGASNHVSSPRASGNGNAVTPKLISRKKTLHRSAANLAAAVTLAKGEAGKVIANKEGPDGFRFGWQRLMEYFKTTFGASKIISDGQAGDPGTVPESSIKKKSEAKDVAVVMPDGAIDPKGKRDAMPSWCGIFAFWALNKAGLPMKKWELGKMTIPREAASPTPQPGFLAYRNLRSHYGLVERSDGTSVTSINGNTSGEDNLGGEIQVQTHAINSWTAFIDPVKLIEGTIRSPETGVAEKPKSLRELRKELFGVQRKEEEGAKEEKNIQTKATESPLAHAPPVQAKNEDKKEELQRKEEKQEEEQTVQRKAFVTETAAATTLAPAVHVQAKSAPKVQRGIFSAIGGAISGAVEWVGDKLEEGKKWLLKKVADLIIKVPGYKALRVALGEDPITGEDVERNGYNFIDAALDIIPGGDLLKQKLTELGILDQAAQFVDKTIGRIDNLISGISTTFDNFVKGITLADLKDIPGVFSRLERAFTDFFNHVIEFAKGVGKDFLEFIKKALLIPLATYIKTKTRFWDLLCLVMGMDPLTDEVKPVNGTNILNAFLNLSEWGVEQRKKMQETGTFSKVAAWIDKGISIFSKSYTELKAAFTSLWDYVKIESLMEPTETFKKIFDSFWKPIKRVTDYVEETAIMILKIVKDVLFKWISNEANKKKGYYLITVLINKDPFTGVVVPRNTENIIKGFMMLTEGGEEQFNKMKESGAMAKATQQIDAAVKTLGFSLAYVKGLFMKLWDSLSWKDFIMPIMAFAKIVDTFKDPVLRLIRFVITVMMALFEVLLRMMGFPVDMVFKLIDNAKKAWNSIKANPSGFFINVLKAIKQGFVQFFDNFLKHLVNGLVDWFFDQLKDVGVTRPPDFSLKSIIALVMQVLGISMEKIWKKLADKIGQDKVAKIRGAMDKLEGIWKFIKDVQERGIGAIWDYIKEQLSNLWTMVLDAATKWIMDKIITQVTVKLLSMLDPTGIMAVVNSCIAIYKAIESFIQYFTRMLGIVNSFVEGIIEIAEGNVKKAADFLERSMASAVPVVIGFLANQVSLGKIGKKIVEIIEKVQATVDKALDWLVDKAVSLGTSFLNTVKKGVAAITNWWKAKTGVTTKDGVAHTLYFSGSGDSAVLMIATTPMPVKSYLVTEVKDKHGLKDSDIQKPLKTAEDIEKEEKKPAKDEADKINTMNTLLGKLAGEIAALPLKSSGTNSAIMYGPMYGGHFASSATVAFRQAPFTEGSEPPDGGPDPLINMNIRKNGGSPYYVKGHLLNDNLGGPGDWRNLTPITIQANSDHKTQFENKVKLAVNGTEARGVKTSTLAPQGLMKGFSVAAFYGRAEPPALAHLKDDSKDDLPKGANPSWDADELIKILEAEKFAPTKLVCSATIQKKGATADEVASYTVDNEINYGDLSKYQLGLRPKQPVTLASYIQASAKGNKKLMAQSFKEVKGIGPVRAEAIYEVFDTKGKITNGKADIGIGLAALNRMNPDKIITSGTI